MSDSVTESLTALIDSCKTHPNYELEIRLGKFSPHFEPGMPNDCMAFIKRLNTRLKYKARENPGRWRLVAEHVFMRPRYANNVRGTCAPNVKSVFVRKTALSHIDLPVGNRAFDLRVALSEETPINLNERPDVADTVQRSAPESVQYVQRASYQEVLRDGSVLQYDVSKVSKEMPNKFQATQHAPTYQVELELVSANGPSIDIARTMLARAMALLGTHRFGTNEALPRPVIDGM